MAQEIPGLRVAAASVPWAERVLLPICATALIGGFLVFQALVVWVVLSLEEVLPPPETLDRIRLEPAAPVAGETVAIHYDWSGIHEGYELARVALVHTPKVQPEGAPRQPEYLQFARGEVANWTIPGDAVSITIIGLKPRSATHPLELDLGDR